MLTIGAPHSSTDSRHSCTVSLSLIVDSYSRMRPQPVHVRLQACNGSSISTSGNRLVPDSFFLAMYPAIDIVRLSGNRIGFSLGISLWRPVCNRADGQVENSSPRSCRPADILQLDTIAHRRASLFQRLPVTGQRHQGEVNPIVVIFQIEDLRETGAGELVFVPRSVGLLRAQEIGDAVPHGAVAGLAGGQQPQERPAGLRRGRRPLPRQLRLVVGAAALAPGTARL